MKTYIVNASGWINRKWREAGEEVLLSEQAAKYENVTLKTDDPAPAKDAKERKPVKK